MIMDIEKRKIIVIGASGYIGRLLFDTAKINSEVYGTASSPTDHLLEFRLDEPDEFDYKIIRSSDIVLLTAAISSPDICTREYVRAWAVNVTGVSEFIIKVLARGGRILFFSSDTVYGERDEDVDEYAVSNPAGEYAEMKHEVEKRFFSNPRFKSIRLSYVFSLEDKFTKYLSSCMEKGEEAQIFHPFYRAVVHRDDVVQGILALAQYWDKFPQTIVNFGGPEILARTEFTQILKETILQDLCYRVTEPDDKFFHNRPRIIRMKSPLLRSLLGRPAHTLRQACRIELKKKEGLKYA